MKPYFEHGELRLYESDCLSVLQSFDAESAESCVTDPPYDLTSVSRNGSRRTNNPDNSYGRHKLQGFMGKGWDGTGVAFRPDVWHEVLRVLKPGGYLLAFGGTRTYHRMACAIEDAGFVIKDSIHWMYGSGFPKSVDVGDGWGTALKPGHEPIVVAQKPLRGTYAANIERWGVGGLNIDGCRIAAPDGVNGSERTGAIDTQTGRWPANVVLDEDAAAELDAQSGILTSGIGSIRRVTGTGYRPNALGAESRPAGTPCIEYGDSGGASRFYYVAKASPSERGRRNNHPTVKPVALMRWLVRLVTPAGGLVLDPFAGSGTTGLACAYEGFRFAGIEREAEYCAVAARRLAGVAIPLGAA